MASEVSRVNAKNASAPTIAPAHSFAKVERPIRHPLLAYEFAHLTYGEGGGNLRLFRSCRCMDVYARRASLPSPLVTASYCTAFIVFRDAFRYIYGDAFGDAFLARIASALSLAREGSPPESKALLRASPERRAFAASNAAEGSRAMIALDFDSPEPLYQQIYRSIRDDITARTIPAGTKLTAIRRLADDLHVARNTVEGAYLQLATEGYVASRPGIGLHRGRPGFRLARHAGVCRPARKAAHRGRRTVERPVWQ